MENINVMYEDGSCGGGGGGCLSRWLWKKLFVKW